MTTTDVINIFQNDIFVFRIYDRTGKPLTEFSGSEEVERFSWERKTAVGKHELLPMVKIYLV